MIIRLTDHKGVHLFINVDAIQYYTPYVGSSDERENPNKVSFVQLPSRYCVVREECEEITRAIAMSYETVPGEFEGGQQYDA